VQEIRRMPPAVAVAAEGQKSIMSFFKKVRSQPVSMTAFVFVLLSGVSPRACEGMFREV
jgi:hypothetical protein